MTGDSEESDSASRISYSDKESTHTDVDTPISCFWCNKRSCRTFWCSFSNCYWKLLGMFVAVTVYMVVGGAIFNAVERPNELRSIQEARDATDTAVETFVEMLTNSTNLTLEEAQNLTVQFLELGRITAEANQNLAFDQNPIWDFSSALFFASTIVTTIGYGTIAPATAAGQIFFMFYVIFGIPLALLFLTQIGKVVEAWVHRTLKPIERRWGATVSRAIGSVSLLLTTLIFFILIPAAIYSSIEPWNFRESVYFTMVTLTTVGFGDFVPAQSGVGASDVVTRLYKVINAIWLWMGLALVAALISELQELLSSHVTWCHDNPCCGLKMKLEIRKEKAEKQELAEVIAIDVAPKQSPHATPTTTDADAA